MSVLVLRLAGPLQSWGVRSRFVRRTTEPMPTKSGIIGLLAAAQGYRREDPIEPLLGLRLAVRSDQQGTMLRDFHTAHHAETGRSMPLSERYYWADAVFVAFVEGARPVIEGLAEALQDPGYPLYLGRRSCVPEGRLVLGVEDAPIEELVRQVPWQAGATARRAAQGSTVTVDVQADEGVFPGLAAVRQVQDLPVSFDPVRREYATRPVVDTTVELTNPAFHGSVALAHDPMALAGEFA